MTKALRIVPFAGILWAGLLVPAARADITYIQDGRMCGSTQGCPGKGPIPFDPGETFTLNVKGQDVNSCKAASASGTGVTATYLSDKLIADGFGFGTGQIDVRVAVAATAAPGPRTITISQGCGPFTFTIQVLRNGVVSGMNAVPRQSTYFTTVDVTVTGTNISGAGARVQQPFPAAGTTVQVVSNTATSAVIRFTFSTGQSKATGQLVLFDASFRRACDGSLTFGCYGAPLSYTLLGPNAIESISFPTGSNIRPGSVLTIRIRLTQPAPSGTFSPSGGTLGGEAVKWQVHPSDVFTAEPGTTFDPNATLNNLRISPGVQQVDLLVRLQRLPAGCINCTGVAEGRVFDFRDAAPYKRVGTYTMIL